MAFRIQLPTTVSWARAQLRNPDRFELHGFQEEEALDEVASAIVREGLWPWECAAVASEVIVPRVGTDDLDARAEYGVRVGDLSADAWSQIGEQAVEVLRTWARLRGEVTRYVRRSG